MAAETHDNRVRVLSSVNVLLGLWLIVFPWIVGAPGPNVATSGIAAGVLTLLFAVLRFARKHSTGMSWANVLIGAWTMMTPWAFGENSADIRTFNYVVVGLLIVAMEAYSLTSSATQSNRRQRETGPR
jgi:hypothetical protein